MASSNIWRFYLHVKHTRGVGVCTAHEWYYLFVLITAKSDHHANLEKL